MAHLPPVGSISRYITTFMILNLSLLNLRNILMFFLTTRLSNEQYYDKTLKFSRLKIQLTCNSNQGELK